MFQQTFAIIRNTFFESVRQPIMLVVLGVATFLLIMANPLSAFTMSDDQRMYIDMGLATIFLCGALLASFIATNVLGREIDNRTVLTIVSKPVSRPLFVIGKFLGVAAALVVGSLYMAFVFLLAEQHTVLQTVRDPLHLPVLTFGTLAAVIGLGVGIWCNYFYNKVFASTVICVTTPLAGLAYLFSLMFRADFSVQPILVGFKPQLWLAICGLVVAILILTALAVAASTRFGQVMTLVITIGVFLMGMLSDWFIGRPLSSLQQDWVNRAATAPAAQLQELVPQAAMPQLREWIVDIHREQALHNHAVSECIALNELFKMRGDVRGNRPVLTEDPKIQLARTQLMQRADDQLAAALREAQHRADMLAWPPAKSDLVLEFDVPRIVKRTTGECETISSRETMVFPPVLDAMKSPAERWKRLALQTAYAIVPNFQVLLQTDAVTQGHKIPLSFVGSTAAYGGLHILAALSLAVLLFQSREVG